MGTGPSQRTARLEKPKHHGPGRFTRGHFNNPHKLHLRRRLGHLLLWAFGCYKDKVPNVFVPEEFKYPDPERELDVSQPMVTWLNHSTSLIQVGGLAFLTDPVWSRRCSPLPFMGPTRLHPPCISLEQLPHIDYVLISHNHYDHLDRGTVRKLLRLQPHITWCVPLGVARWLRKQGARYIVELDWWGSHHSKSGDGPQVEITATPAQHYSGRTPFDYNKTLWCGWGVKVHLGDGSTKVFYFCGDTGYNTVDFKEIGRRFGKIDLSLLPIGAYRPRAFMRTVHTGPREAVWIHREVHSRLSVGIHWGTFRLSLEPSHQPPYDLYCAMIEHALPPETFRVLQPGQTINW